MSRRRWAAVAATSLLAAALAAGLAPDAEARPPISYTPAELGAAKQTLDQRLESPPNGVTSWYVDPASNRVKVSVLAGDATAMTAARKSIAGLSGAIIETVSERPRPLYNLVGGDAILAGDGRCSIGFSARNSAGQAFVLTAGHCTKAGTDWKGYNQVTLGTTSGVNFPTDDFGSIKVTSSSWTPTAQVRTSSGLTTITGSTEAAVGATVCRSGSTTGYHCGAIQVKNATVNYGGGDVVYGLTRTSVCAEPGDSGGSWISGTQAQGLTSGGSGNCSRGGTTYFQPVNEALQRYGLALVTASTPPPVTVATLCSDVNYGGTCFSSSADQPNLSQTSVGNDTTSSIKVPTGKWLTLYLDYNYGGRCSSFSSDQTNVSNTTIGNDSASSYKITSSQVSC